MKKFLICIWHLPRNFLRGLIWIYQHTISPDHSWLKIFFPHGACRFTPTCSQYGDQALKKYGVLRALPKIIWRILRCNPWNDGGVDNP
ncbi:MAG: membrane protein insertion efficiency factor YidD [Patescibacteria group bacterium]